MKGILLSIFAALFMSGCSHQIVSKNVKSAHLEKKETKITRTEQLSFENQQTTGYHTNSERAIGLGIPSLAKFTQILDCRAFTKKTEGLINLENQPVGKKEIPYILNGFYAPSFQ